MANRKLENELRASILERIGKHLTEDGEEILKVDNGKICFPYLCGEDDCYVMVTVSIPKGAKGEPFDGYAEAEAYKVESAEKLAKAEEVAKKKAEKVKKDAELRAKKAEQKNNRNK